MSNDTMTCVSEENLNSGLIYINYLWGQMNEYSLRWKLWTEIFYTGGNKKLKPVFSRISGGGSMSNISICSIDFDMSSTENGMLPTLYCKWLIMSWYQLQ